MFKDRQAAGKILAKRLRDTKADLVLGIPRGGVVVAKEVAKSLNLPLDVVVTRKIGAPTQPELALGAVDPDGEVVWDPALRDQFKIENLKLKIDDEMKEIKRREELYRQGKKQLDVKNKAVILVDDGMATGATTLSAVKYLKRHGVKVILAVPVTSQEALEKVRNNCDEAVILHAPEYFQAVGQFYQEFESVSDEEVIQYLK
ncbi:phosphoribosyltransferase [Candidatus Daviesbacteria bacterium]|nr:phosphoribosyltransferase [Candidatus Daviesbacteria bacterium]